MNWIMDHLPKSQRDALIIIRHEILRSVSQKDLGALKQRGLITEKFGGGWMATSLGRDFVRRLK